MQDAVDNLNDNLPDDQKIDIQHQQPWGKVDGQWRPLGTGERIWNWITNANVTAIPSSRKFLSLRPLSRVSGFRE